jgi:undecaprenyl-diphosphatase
MNIINAIILGIVQGLTEFLPVSSSGHLVLLQKIFNIEKPPLFFDTMLHVGTLLAVVTVLWKDIFEILKKPIQKLTGFLILATIPAVIAALLFEDAIEEIFTTGKLLGVCFIITAALLVTAELLSRRNKNANSSAAQPDENGAKMTWFHALFIGIMQALAIPPGISRSGATISGSLFCKLDRNFAARFSFLMSIPAILGAVVMQTKKLVSHGSTEGAHFGTAAIIVGTIVSAVVGFFAVKFMLKIIKEKSLFGFAIYTGVLGLIVLILQMTMGF